MNSIDTMQNNYKSNLRNLRGTFEAEGMKLSDECILNLERLAKGEESCIEIVEKMKMKYMRGM